jgi:hypothetical protein
MDESGEILARAGEGLGGTLERIGDEQYAQKVNYARAQASNALLDHEIAVKNTTEQLRQDIADGKVPWDQASEQYQTQVAKIETPQIDNLDPIGQENFERGIKRNVLGGAVQVDGLARAGRKQSFIDQFQAAQDKLGKLAGMPDADVASVNGQIDSYRPMALEAGIPANVVDKSIQDFKDKNWLNQAVQRSMEAKDAPDALEKLRKDLSDSDGFYQGKLDTDKRNAVLRGVINDQLILQNRMEREADKREAKAQQAVGRMDEQISSGVPATPDMWAQWESVTKGTSFEEDFKQRMKDEDQVQQILREPVDQQQAFVEKKSADLMTNGGSLKDRANLIRLQTAVNQNVNLLQKAPLLYAANREGVEPQPINFSGLSTPDGQQQIAATVADRMATLKSMQKEYGSAVQPLPLLPGEAASLAGELQHATPDARVGLLQGLRDTLNDDTAYQSVMRQIAPHSPVTAIAGHMLNAQSPASTPAWYSSNFAPSPLDVQRVVRGEALLNPGAGGKDAAADQESGKGALKGGMPMPEDRGASGLRANFAAAAGDMFRDRPELADSYYSVFKDAYASLLAESGNMKGTGDPKLERQALSIALGNSVTFNGQKYSVPAGMDPSKFEGLVHNAVGSTLTAMKLPADWADRIRGYQLREIGGLGSGRYELTDGTRTYFAPGTTRPVTIDLRDQYLGARGLHRGSPDFPSAEMPAEGAPAGSMAGTNADMTERR